MEVTGMARDLIQVYRGSEANLPSLAIGEFGLTTDTNKLFIGGIAGNIELTFDSNDIDVLNKVWDGVSTGSDIVVTTDGSYDYVLGKWVIFKADADIIAPATVSIDGGLALTAKDTSGVNIDITQNAVYLCSLDNDGADFFQLASGSGGGSGGGGAVSRVQTGVTSFANSNAFKQITISQVDLTKSIVRMSYTSDPVPLDHSMVAINFLNDTTIDIRRNGASDDVNPINWEVIEYEGVKSLQRGQETYSGTSHAITISAVDPAKSILVCTFRDDNSTSTEISRFSRAYRLSNATTIQINSLGSATSSIVEYQVIEFN